ncbi:hypothetical protein P7C71_g3915, partial [Lecanoromycetidae sp. Uapishka_2]
MPRPRKSTSRLTSASKASQSQDSSGPKKQKRQATVYDAVAGILVMTHVSPTVPNPPEEVLFRRVGAPVRYEEADIYWADRHLSEEQKLPESDLLKAVHAYASDFYDRATVNHGIVDFESLDETALLGLGILLEETVEDVLGETGDLAFVEGEEDEDGGQKGFESGAAVGSRGKKQGASPQDELETAVSGSATESGDKRKRKRRKTKHDHDENEGR